MIPHRLVVFVHQRHRRAEYDLVARQRQRIDDLRTADLVLDIANGRLDLALTFLGGMIFGVFRQIAVRTRFFDCFDNRRALFTEAFQVGGQLFIALGQHRIFFKARHEHGPYVTKMSQPAEADASSGTQSGGGGELLLVNNSPEVAELQAPADQVPQSPARRPHFPQPSCIAPLCRQAQNDGFPHCLLGSANLR